MSLRLLAFALISLFIISPVWADDDEARLNELKSEIKKLEHWLNSAKDEYAGLNKSLKQSDEEIGALLKQIQQTQTQLREEQARLKKLRLEQTQLHQLQTEHQRHLSQQVIASRNMGDESALRLWLAQDDPQQSQRLMRYFSYFNQARVENIEHTMAELVRLDQIAELIVQQEQALKSTEQSLLNKNTTLSSKRKDQQRILANLSKKMNTESQRLTQKQADRKRLENLLAEVETILANSPRQNDERPFNKMKGKLPRPVAGRVLKAFGNANSETMSRWEGWQIGVQEGAEVRAIHHGRVVFSDWLRGFGLLLIIDHGQGYLSLYAHNETLLRDVGSWVNGGDIVAAAGRSGGLTDPALYFEIRYQGRPQDPAVWIR
ncbi:murein hydrolase activator EnvC family protein [Thalassolituus sp.]|jgi:septal ring factor EnvC (AmiA/AmiB activator)|uniref:murein hydrolase activator EnvC family protein n=1 Tax=Thalassolituus sp. TaxID=2030822 RepID=UPI002A83C4E1|nr:peptidoglycan DD-metalloendopeptidase family protein [Thalassolituus sp.]